MRGFVIALALGVGACSTSPQPGGAVNGVSLSAASTTTRDAIVLTLTNGSARDVGYNLCPTGVERLTGDTWQNVPTDRSCTMELRTLDPGARATLTTTLPVGATAGDYRFVAGVEIPIGGDRRTVISNIVRVQ